MMIDDKKRGLDGRPAPLMLHKSITHQSAPETFNGCPNLLSAKAEQHREQDNDGVAEKQEDLDSDNHESSLWSLKCANMANIDGISQKALHLSKVDLLGIEIERPEI